MKPRILSYLDAKAAYELDVKNLKNCIEYGYAMDANSIVEHTKLLTKSLNQLAKNIEIAAKSRLDYLNQSSNIHLKRGAK